MNHAMTPEIHGTSILILGYGREGKSIHAWLTKQSSSLKISIADRTIDGESYLRNIDLYDTVIRSPGVSPYLDELVAYRNHGGHITTGTNIFFSLVPGTVIGVTGTKGKSTTSSLIAHILSGAYDDVRLVGNIGVPMLDHLDGATDKTFFVVELSSHQLDDVRYSPHVAVLLGIVPEHLDYYPDVASYVAAKANIMKFQTPSDVFVFNPESPRLSSVAAGVTAKKCPFGLGKKSGLAVYKDGGSIWADKKEILRVADIPLLGNIENILAAVTVADCLNVPHAVIAARVKSFQSLPHRLEPVGEYRGIRFYNDSLATIPEATVHALESLFGDVATLIAGGFDRHLDFSVLATYLAKHPVQTMILFPDTGEKIWQAIPQKTRGSIQRFDALSMKEAVALAYAHTQKGKICLLSPASSSFNLFRDYADRGEQYKAWVKELGKIL